LLAEQIDPDPSPNQSTDPMLDGLDVWQS